MIDYQSYAEIEELEPEYLLESMLPPIPRSDVTILYGSGGIGKGRMISGIIAEVTNGGGTVIVIQPEDDPNEQVRPRLETAGADLSRVIDLTMIGGSRFKLAAGTRETGHLQLLATAIDDLNKSGHYVQLVVIDPIAAVALGTISTNRGARALIEPLQDLADKTGVSILAVAHAIKDGTLQGSAGLRDAARLVYKVAVDETDPTVREVIAEKHNNLPDAEPLRFTIEPDEQGRPRVIWLTRDEMARRIRDWRTPAAIQRVTEALATADRPLNPQEIASLAGVTYGHARVLLHRMTRDGLVYSPARGLYTPPRVTSVA
jgi:KaiC/GvpD/RAD55 family RecA-like ATPase